MIGPKLKSRRLQGEIGVLLQSILDGEGAQQQPDQARGALGIVAGAGDD